MTVFVDDMVAGFGRMKMCHMIADTTDELLAMAERIGVARKWLQKAGTYQEHFDICIAKRALAVQAGAVEVTMKDLGRKLRERRMASNVDSNRTPRGAGSGKLKAGVRRSG